MADDQPAPPHPETESENPRPSAEETFKHYGVLSLIATAFFIWFVRDGWFNDDPKMLEHLTFNRIGTVVVGAILAFFLIMAGSAGFTVLRERRRQQTPPS
jgi:hypothetical protein